MGLFNKTQVQAQMEVEARTVLFKIPEDDLRHADPEISRALVRTVNDDRVIRGLHVYKAFGANEEATWLSQACRGIDGADFTWAGPVAGVTIVAPALLDKLLVNLSRAPNEAEALLRRVEIFVDPNRHVTRRFGQSTDNVFANVVGIVGLSEQQHELAASLGAERYSNVAFLQAMLDDYGLSQFILADVTIKAQLIPKSGRMEATMKMHPRKANNPIVGELAFWALWDAGWLMLEGQAQVTMATVNLVNRQCKYYRENGLPGLRDLGAAPYCALESIPFLAMMHRL